jgi:hypothetical protein
MDAATIAAIATGTAAVLKAVAVLVTALRVRRETPPEQLATADA